MCTTTVLFGALALLFASIALHVEAHSWLACTDYTEKGGSVWDPDKCRGFARGGYRKAPKTGVFGGDTGFDYLPRESQACQIRRDDFREYSHGHPMAVYYPGQQVILVHPMKNHGADSGCTNIYIPDSGNWIFRSERNAAQDPSLSEFRKNLVFDLGRSPTGKDFNGDSSLSQVYPKPGFQNAPRFCENTDKAMATFVMNVPEDLTPGIYTFMWLWAFNDINNLYSSCFEVEIVKSRFARDSRLIANGFTDTTEPCGGMTSNRNIRGNSNAGCTPLLGPNGLLDYTYPQMPSTPVTTPYYHRQDTSTTTTTRPYPVQTSTEETDAYEYYYYYGSYGEGEEYGASYGKDDEISSVNSAVDLPMKLTQFTGEIELPAPRSTAVRRHYSVDFNCDVDNASFWNCRVTNEEEVNAPNSPKRHYEIVQEGDRELQHLRLYYHVLYRLPCDIVRFPPRAELTKEEYENI